MTFDGQNFNGMIFGTVKTRMYRLLRDAAPDTVGYEVLQLYNGVHEELFRFPPTISERATPWHVVVVVLAGVNQRLMNVAREHLREDLADRGNYAEFFQLEEKLDAEENVWRASLNLPPVRYNEDQ
jgi:hypothetical protein